MENKLTLVEKIKNLENLTNKNSFKEKDKINKQIIINKNENIKNRIKIYEQNENNLPIYNKLISEEELLKYFNYLINLLNNNIIDLTCKNYFFI
jgi:phosphotransacetylase